jgi:hypothetical protein
MHVHYTVPADFELPLSLHFLGVDLLYQIYRLPSSSSMFAAPETLQHLAMTPTGHRALYKIGRIWEYFRRYWLVLGK